jgi:hypothetical protein
MNPVYLPILLLYNQHTHPVSRAENVGSVCKVYGDNIQKLTAALNERSLRVSTLDSVQWRVDYVLSSSAVKVLYNIWHYNALCIA